MKKKIGFLMVFSVVFMCFFVVGALLFNNNLQIQKNNKDWAPLPVSQEIKKDELYRYYKNSSNVCYNIPLSQTRCLGGVQYNTGFTLVDTDSFQVNKTYYNFSKDKNRVYYADFDKDFVDSVGNIDFSSLEIVNQDVFKDKNNVYVNSWDQMVKIKKNNWLDPATLKGLSRNFLKDKNGIYVRGYSNDYYSKLNNKDIDISSFELKDDQYAIDKNNVFLLNISLDSSGNPMLEKVDGADPESFQMIHLGKNEEVPEFSRDKFAAYYENKKIEGADPKTFTPYQFYCHCTLGRPAFLVQEYSKDAQNVFYRDKKVAGADPASFEVLGWGTAKDKNHVYNQDQVLEGSDPKTYVYVIAHD